MVWVAMIIPSMSALVFSQTEEVDDMQLIQRIVDLQFQLSASEVSEREQAEAELIKIGVVALDHLEPVSDDANEDYLERLARVRQKLEAIAVASVTQPKPIKVQREMPLKDLLELIETQSSNKVEILGGADLLQQPIKLDFEKGSFWEIIHAVGDQANLDSNAFNSDRGVLRLSPRDGMKPKVQIPRDDSGVFDATISEIAATRNLLNPELNHYTLRLRLRWEPRIAPIAISLPAKSVKVVDEFDAQVKMPKSEVVYSGTVNADTPELELSIRLPSVDRQVERLKSLDCELNTILPGRVESFRFRDIGRQQAGFTQSKAGVSVGFEGVEKNEDLYTVLVSIAFDNPSRGLESHLGWVYENEMYLTGDGDKKLVPLATETAGRTKEKITMKYFFADDPSAFTLHYRTPAAIVAVPVKISLKGIPLP